jgi:ABC-2 type transport system ATP-binding protein
MISIRSLTRKYGSVVAVNDFSLEIARGEIVGLLGHNGAGKTTVMKVLTGFLEASSGSVTVDGIDVGADRIEAQRLIGYLPENAPLYPEMLVQEYLQMMGELRGLTPAEATSAAAEAACATGLESRLVQPIDTLSKGYRQRVGLAQAILHKPDVLVLDEPTNGLDPVQIQSIRALIRRLGETTTIILSTHILQEIEAVCDRVLVMIEGELAEDAPLAQLLESSVAILSLESDSARVEERLRAISGVEHVASDGPDSANPGFELWKLACQRGQRIVPAMLETARQAGWTVAAAAMEARTLETVFHELEQAHLVRMAEAEAG